MSRLAVLLVSSLLVFCSAACKRSVPPEQTHDADVRAIQDAEAQWNRDFESRNTARLLAHYAEDAVLMAPGEPPDAGLQAIHKALDRMVADPALSLKFEPAKVEVATSGDLGYSQGSYTLTETDPKTREPHEDRGSYVTTYRKQADGTWKAVADIATSSIAPGSQMGTPQPSKSK